ncbi:MAG: tetratricopeptide repeat protein [Pseudomonadota bacterium]
MLKRKLRLICFLVWPLPVHAHEGHAMCAGSSHEQTIKQCTAVLGSKSSTRHNRLHALLDRGGAYTRLENFDAAVRDYTALIEIVPGTSAAHSLRAHALFTAKRFDEAIEDLSFVLGEEPENTLYLRMRAQAYGSTDRHEDALRDWTRSIELAPENDWAVLQRGFTYIALGNFKAAFTDADEYSRRAPNDPFGHILRGAVHAGLEDFDLAMASLDQAAELGGSDFVRNLQTHLQERGDYEGPIDGIYNDLTRSSLRMCLKVPECRRPI